MNPNKYQIFLQALEAGSIKRAADDLGYSQSAVSQALRSLEDELGVSLLLRRKTGLVLTSEGRQLLPYIEDICDHESQLIHKVDSLKGILSGEIVIGSYHTVACTILPPLIRKFNEIHPEIQFTIHEGDYPELMEMIASGKVDFGFLAVLGNENFEYIPFCQDPMYAVFPGDAPEADLDSYELRNFHGRSIVSLGLHKEVDSNAIFRSEDIHPNIDYIVQEYETVLAMIANHLGIGIMPGMAATTNFDVSFVPLSPAHYRNVGIAIRERSQASNAVQAFLDFIITQRSSVKPPIPR